MQMRDMFPGFYDRTEEELNKLWQESIFVFDANMLLNVYRYSTETRNRYFDILHRLQNRLWIPYQVAYEYQDNRLAVIRGQIEAYKKIVNILHTHSQNLESSLEPYKKKHGFINVLELTREITEKMKSAKAGVQTEQEEGKRAYQSLKSHDTHREQIEMLFHGKIGNPYTNDELEEVYQLAKLRVELQIPPGWKDESKNDFKAYGDTILWLQILDCARSQKKPIIFVTDDGKKDWWLLEPENLGHMKPLPNLVQEMFVEAGVLFHMYQGYEFLEQAESYLKLEVKPEIIEEAKEITQQNKIATKPQQQTRLTQDSFRANPLISGFQPAKALQDAIFDWIAKRYRIIAILESSSTTAKFIATKKEGGSIWIGIELAISNISAYESLSRDLCK
jgi:hypothetical protein